MDYDRFWRKTWSAAMEALSSITQRRATLLPWPKVFVYDLPPRISDWSPSNATVKEVFGPPFVKEWGPEMLDHSTRGSLGHTRIRFESTDFGKVEKATWWKGVPKAQLDALARHVHDTNHYGFARALLWRLWHSPQYRTLNPAEADLFLVPVISLPQRGKDITASCTSNSRRDLVDALPHLTKATAHKHVLVLSKEHYEAYACTGWWTTPTGLLRRFQRISYSDVLPEAFRADVDYMYPRLSVNDTIGCRTLLRPPQQCHHTYLNLHAVPYLGSVHWPTEASSLGKNRTLPVPPWADTAPRKYLMLLLGASHHGDVKVRQRIMEMCRRLQGSIGSLACNVQKYAPRSLLMKTMAKFCLEPAGDSPFRRSMTDSISMGCIPVFFGRAQEASYPLLWAEWRSAASVGVNRAAFLAGEVDLYKLLSAIPPELLALMQRTIAQHGRRFTVSLTDDPDDLVHHLLSNLRDNVLSSRPQEQAESQPGASMVHYRATNASSAGAIWGDWRQPLLR
jgi:hypothetical protein